MDSNITINHNPRERKDFNKIFFLTGYDIGKSLVPIFRSYLISTEFYSTTELLMGASSLKEFKPGLVVSHDDIRRDAFSVGGMSSTSLARE